MPIRYFALLILSVLFAAGLTIWAAMTVAAFGSASLAGGTAILMPITLIAVLALYLAGRRAK